jgi:hypothetical protein
MIRLDWNDLQVGHHVMVHDDADPEMTLVPGRVTMVREASGSNEVEIRISPPGKRSRVVKPRRLTVHLDTGEAPERCWRCEAIMPTRAAPARPPRSRTPRDRPADGTDPA